MFFLRVDSRRIMKGKTPLAAARIIKLNFQLERLVPFHLYIEVSDHEKRKGFEVSLLQADGVIFGYLLK